MLIDWLRVRMLSKVCYEIGIFP